MALLFESLTFGLAVAFMLLALVGTILPVVPGTFLAWLTALIYGFVTGFAAINWGVLAVLTLIALVTGTADFWLPLLGAKKTGASGRSILLGVVGGIIGTLFAPLIGTVIGYALGILLGEYMKHRDWQVAWRASLGGLAGWGIATAVQMGGVLLMMLIFVARVLTA